MLKIGRGERLPMHEIIETPSFGLNYALGGGLWTGRFHTFWGNPSAGKSTLSLHTLADAQDKGFTPYIIDSEGSITDAWVEKCGIKLDNRIVLRRTIVEDILKEVLPAMREEGGRYAFLFDSINTMVAEQFYKNDDSQGGMAMYARSQTFMLQKLANELIANTNHIVIMVAQQTMDLSGSYPQAAAKIGNATHHWSSNIIKFYASQAAKSTIRDESSTILDHEVFWTISKSKQRPVIGAKGGFWYNPSNAEIDMRKEVLDLAVKNGVIERAGPYYRIGDEKYQGRAKALEAMTDGMVEKITAELSGKELEFDVDDSVLGASF